MALNSPPGGAFSIYETAHSIWLRISSTAIEKVLKALWASLVAQLVKKPPAMQETWVQS